jgi:hypothetical protein
MNSTEQQVQLRPENATWALLSDELLTSLEIDRWTELANEFQPTEHQAGVEMADWFRDGIKARKMPLTTWAIHTSDELLGFYAIKNAEIEFSRRAFPILAVRRRSIRVRRLKGGPQPGLLLSSIARSNSTRRGFGRILFEHALGIAHEDRKNVALFVLPANHTVSQMWQGNYQFKLMDEPIDGLSEVLWFPVDPTPEGDWP